MSVEVDKKNKEQIYKELRFTKTNEFQKISTNIFGYQDSPTRDTIRVPFRYGISKFMNPKSNIVNPSINWISGSSGSSGSSGDNFPFVGSLTPKQKEIFPVLWHQIINYKSSLWGFHCGFGKTTTSVYMANQLKLKTCIIVHRILLMDQWLNTIKRHLPWASVAIIDSSIKEDKRDTLSDNDFVIVNIVNIPKYEGIWKHYSFVIVDECHILGGEKMFSNLFHFKPQYLLGLSATPYRSDGMHVVLEWFFGKSNRWVIIPLFRPFNVYIINTNFKPVIKQTYMKTLDWNYVLEQQTENEERNKLIINIVNQFSNRNILILCKRKSQSNYLHSNIEDSDLFIGSSKYYNSDKRVLVSTYSKSGVGFDCPHLDMLIIASDVEEMIEQYVGRIFRKQNTVPIVVDLRDKCHILGKHLSTRLNYYNSIGGKLNNLFLN